MKSKKAPAAIEKNCVIYVRGDLLAEEEVKARYNVDLFDDDKACGRCPVRPYRSPDNDSCSVCPGFLGSYQFFKEVRHKASKKPFYALPGPDANWIRKKLGGKPILDRRKLPRMRKPIKFTAELYGPNSADSDGNPRADQLKLVSDWESGGTCGIIQAAPRTGKCCISIHLACKAGLRTIILTDRIDLLRQFRDTLLGDKKRKRMAFTNAGRYEGSVEIVDSLDRLEKTKADFVLITAQKAYLDRNMDRFTKIVAGRFGTLIVDECHQMSARRFAQVASAIDAPVRIGTSATPARRDGRDKLAKFIVGPVTAISESVSLTPTIKAMFIRARPAKAYKTYSKAVSWTAKSPERAQEISKAVLTKIREGHKSILVAVGQLATLHELVRVINVDCVSNTDLPADTAIALHGRTKNREEVLRRADNLSRVTVTVSIMSLCKQGLDLRGCSCVFVCVPLSASELVGAPAFRQLSFRSATPFKGKKAPEVIVLVDQSPMLNKTIQKLWKYEILPNSVGKAAKPSYIADPKSTMLLLEASKREKAASDIMSTSKQFSWV